MRCCYPALIRPSSSALHTTMSTAHGQWHVTQGARSFLHLSPPAHFSLCPCSTPSASPTPYPRASTLLPAAAAAAARDDDDDDTGGGVLDEDDEANATTETKEARRMRRKAGLWEEFVLRREGMQTRAHETPVKGNKGGGRERVSEFYGVIICLIVLALAFTVVSSSRLIVVSRRRERSSIRAGGELLALDFLHSSPPTTYLYDHRHHASSF